MEPHVADIIRVIQLVVAPVFLLTAVATMIVALNTRLGRAVDRRRMLEDALLQLSGDDAEIARNELAQIQRRVWYVYFAILCAVLCALFVCLLIMAALIVSLLSFLREIFLAVYTPRHVPHPALR